MPAGLGESLFCFRGTAHRTPCVHSLRVDNLGWPMLDELSIANGKVTDNVEDVQRSSEDRALWQSNPEVDPAIQVPGSPFV